MKIPDGDRPWVAYFADLYANYLDPQIGEATVLILQHHGFDVFVPPRQRGSGIEAFAQGDAETARDNARDNLRVFADLAGEGIPIICSEPVPLSCSARIIRISSTTWTGGSSPAKPWS